MKELHKRYTAALESAKSERTLDGFMTAFNTNWEEEQRRRLNIKNTKEYKDYKAELEKIAGTTTSISEDASDPDIVVTGGNFVNFNDPWTKAIMKNPVRNTICGHNYDKDSVIGLIKDNIGIICPVLGCASKTPIQPHHLTPNVELRIEIEKLQSLEEND
ncbi:E3 SUMO-protein ligase NSE2-like isoform X2 [Scaptodrosophila lebanonensis]|nr:E3 SUMO-protein ligase NSE2-like isoform X2 [Scaptodrosophila lebanonensis]